MKIENSWKTTKAFNLVTRNEITRSDKPTSELNQTSNTQLFVMTS